MEPYFPMMEWDLHFVSQTKIQNEGCKKRHLTQEEGARRVAPGKQEAGDRPGDH